MLKNYLTVALRLLHRAQVYTVVNVVGLAVGLACCLLIVLYVQHELSYDRFHEDANRIFRIARIDDNAQTRTPHPMAQALVMDFSEVESAVSLTPLWGPGLTRPTYSVRHGDVRFEEREILVVDSTFFDVFSFPVIAGDGPAALREPGQILLTVSAAQRYFGDEDPIGQTLRFNDAMDVTVGAVLADVPDAAHFHFDFLLSYVSLKQLWQGSSFFEWEDFGHYNYVRLADGAAATAVEDRIPSWLPRYLDLSEDQLADLESGSVALRLQPLTDIHLHSHLRWELEPNGHITTVYVLIAAAFLILLLACINFMNLATARSAQRAREVGVRKALGAHRGQLAGQFLGESVLFSSIAVLGALVLVQLALPSFNDLTGLSLALPALVGLPFVAGLMALALGVGLVAGLYPALVLSGFQPARVLKGDAVVRAGGVFRRGLVVFQFTVTIVLLVGAFVIAEQLDYLRSAPLGFDAEHLVVLPIPDDSMREQVDAVKEELRRDPSVLRVAATSNVPGGSFNQNSLRGPDGREVPVAELRVDYDFLETLGVELTEGRAFARAFPADAGETFLLNEAAVRRFDVDPVGEEVAWLDDDTTYTGPVVGVVRDFHHASLHDAVGPMALQVMPDEFNHLLVKVRPDDWPRTLVHLEQTWTSFAPSRTFDYSFLDANLDQLYAAEARTGTLIGLFSALAVFIACLGLFGLATHAAERRRKEIGVRKVLGASATSVAVLLTRDFLVLVGLAMLLAAPVAYVAAERWLEAFALRIDLGPELFLLAGGLALAIALLTVGAQALRAATADPVKSLRYE